MGSEAMRIVTAEPEDLPLILSLQKRAYESEARLLNDFDIPPLRQTLEGLRADHDRGVVLKALAANGGIVGSVRGYREGDTLHIGKLIVDPDWQGRGIGRALLAAIEARFPGCRCELFTSDRSARNLALYARCGYVEFKRVAQNETLSFVFLEKRAG